MLNLKGIRTMMVRLSGSTTGVSDLGRSRRGNAGLNSQSLWVGVWIRV